MTPRTYRAATVLLLLAFSASFADAGFWPSRWISKPKTPAPTQAPGTPPVAAWPPRAADLPQITLPAMPSGPSLLGPGASAGPAPRLPVPQSPAPQAQVQPPARSRLASAVELGRPTPLTDAPWNVAPIATLPAVSPLIPANPTRPAPGPVPPYAPPGVSMAAVPVEIQQVSDEQRFDSPRVTTTVRAQIEDGAIQPVRLDGPPPVPPPTNDPPLPPLPPGGYNAGVELTQPLNRSFGDQCAQFFGFGGPGNNCWFQSDHSFDETTSPCYSIISPVTNPFFFEDPRSLTELRPLWVYAKIPYSTSLGGGQAGFLGTQARLAFTPNFSVVMNKLGGIGLHPEEPNAAGVDGESGFAEVNIGPKWTFWRSEALGMVAATGLTFQLPVGSSKVYQDTGTMGLDLYGSYGWSFGRTSWGSFNYLTSLGYDFRLDETRSEFFHTNQHLSFDIGNWHKIYPLVEFSWYKYTRTGQANSFDFEGKDLFNFGSTDAGLHSYFSIATGARFKLNENIQTGIAAEWNVHSTPESLDKFRLTFDLIFRY